MTEKTRSSDSHSLKYVEALDEWTWNGDRTRKAIFLGGGITNCPDWQAEARECLSFFRPDLILLNPRRSNFPMGKLDEGRKQIKWEQRHIERAHGMLFWFPKETLCPITLFELGRAMRSHKPLFVGTHPDYQRRFDLQVQFEDFRPDITIYSSVRQLCEAVRDNFKP
jgi:hypothetical protein